MKGNYFYLSMYYPYWEPLPAEIKVSLEKRAARLEIAKRKTRLEVSG